MMPVQGPDHAFYIPDASDQLAAARPWAPRAKRRWLVLAALAVFAGLAAGVALTIDGVFAGEASLPGVAGVGTATLAFAALAMWVDRMLFKATRPAFALPGEIYDERQAQLNDAARRSARWIGYAAIAALTVAGAAGGTPGVVIAVGVASFGLVMSGQQLVLAWTLDPEDFAFGDDA